MQEVRKELPEFETAHLAQAVEKLSPEEIDRLPYGVVGLDANDVVRVFNKAEARLSGFNDRPSHGKLFFVDVAPCMNNGYFKGRIDRARTSGTLDISFTFVGDFSDVNAEVDVRAQSASDGGLWIFYRREKAYHAEAKQNTDR